ncbi:MAG: PAS domain-containing sensor histidine kinase [Alphaproteobacteria bacterium]
MNQHGFPPYAVMITIDIAMIAMACGLCALCFIKRKLIREAGAGAGVAFLVAGFTSIAALYLADLYMMTLLPLSVGGPAAMEAMAALHTQYNWYTYLFALFAMMCGIFLCIRSFSHQLWDQKTARSISEESEELLRAVLDNSPSIISIRDVEGRYQLVNRAYERRFGVTNEEIRGKSPHDIMPRDFAADLADYDRMVIESGKPLLHEHKTALGADDDTLLSARFPIRDASGNLVSVGSIATDISERKRAEKRLHDAIESIADGFVLFDADDRVVIWNQRFADIFPELADLLPKKPTAEEMFRERIRIGAVGAFDIPVNEYVRWRMEMRRKQGGTPAVHRHSDGRWTRTTERRTSEGGIVAISTDISELKNHETGLREAKEQAEFANRSKSEFLANMSHELRTPLNAVIGFSETMAQEIFGPLGNEKYQQYANDIFDSGSHLLSLITDILDLSKIEAGELELYEEVVDVALAVRACRRIIVGRAKEAGLTLATRLSGELPKLWADERAVKQIVLNLLSNAVKFTPPGGNASLHAEVDEDGCFVLSVSDTGIGIDVDDIPRMFTPFSQVEGSVSRRHEGTGLGLPLVKSLVEMHGGTIKLESELGTGTIATVCFPAERVLDGPAKTKGPVKKENPAKTKGNGVKAGAAR